MIEARDVTKTYGTVEALRSLSLSIGPGEYVAITGPSGSGKSTLMHLLGGLDRPTSGDIMVGGERLAQLSTTRLADVRNRRIGFVFQFFNLLPGLTAEENVALPALIAGRRPGAYRARVDDLLGLAGLAGKASRFPSELSGGEQQRVAIARALIMDPEVVLADEPTGNLDSRSGSHILDMLKQCHAAGQTVVLVTHDLRVATQTQRVVSLRDGELVDDAKLDTAAERKRAISLMVESGGSPASSSHPATGSEELAEGSTARRPDPPKRV